MRRGKCAKEQGRACKGTEERNGNGRQPPPRLLDPAPAWLALRTGRTGGARRTAGPPAGHADDAPAGAGALRRENDVRLARVCAEAPLLLTPTAPTAPHGHDGPGDVYSTALTWAFNLSGHPALSLPAGLGTEGCPAGLQLVAPHGREDLLLAVARAAEAGTQVRAAANTRARAALAGPETHARAEANTQARAPAPTAPPPSEAAT